MIVIEKENNQVICRGHADYADYGKDIVCASVSSIVVTTINAIMSIEDSIIAIEDDNEIRIKIKNKTNVNDKLIENMMLMLEDLAKKYPKNIKITK